jgi:DNA mismatch repair protein MutS2
VLESLPDQKGRVRVKTGSATIVVPSDRLAAVAKPAAKPEQGRVRFEAATGADAAREALRGGGTLHCDLRGLRVEEAREKVAAALDRALADDRAAVEFIHGIGTGALRRTVREELAASDYVTDIQSGDPDHGGDGVTTAVVGRS